MIMDGGAAGRRRQAAGSIIARLDDAGPRQGCQFRPAAAPAIRCTPPRCVPPAAARAPAPVGAPSSRERGAGVFQRPRFGVVNFRTIKAPLPLLGAVEHFGRACSKARWVRHAPAPPRTARRGYARRTIPASADSARGRGVAGSRNISGEAQSGWPIKANRPSNWRGSRVSSST